MTNQTLSKTGFNPKRILSVYKARKYKSDTIPSPGGSSLIVDVINAFTEGVNLLDGY